MDSIQLAVFVINLIFETEERRKTPKYRPEFDFM